MCPIETTKQAVIALIDTVNKCNMMAVDILISQPHALTSNLL
jgi:hypothetical protein